jgi:trans-aconitate methyltransferase
VLRCRGKFPREQGADRERTPVRNHVLASREDVVEWTKGTLLTEYEKRLSPGLFSEFAAAYREQLIAVLPPDRPFFLPFRRILCWGRMPGCACRDGAGPGGA